MSCYKKKEIAVVRAIDTKVIVLGHDKHHDRNWLLVVWPNTRKITRVDPFDLIKLRVFEANNGRARRLEKPKRRAPEWD